MFCIYNKTNYPAKLKVPFLKMLCLVIMSSISTTAIFAQSPAETQDSVKLTDKTKQAGGKPDIIPVLFRQQAVSNLVESVNYIKGSQLENTPAASLLYGLSGRISGLYTSQLTGEPGQDYLNMRLRSGSPLILIDGVVRSTISMNPEQIESVSILKGPVENAMLGMRGMNGAILITTKKGVNTKNGFAMNVKAQAGLQAPTRMRKYLSAFDYATLYNEALQNDGKPLAYSQADLDAYKNGTDPYGHPNVDWTKTILKNNAAFSRYTINAEGSNRSTNYFVSLDYLNQGGLLRELDSNKYSTNSTFKRYIFRSNIETKITDRFKIFLNIFGRIRTGNEPGIGSENIFPDLNTTPNNAYPVYNPNKSFGGNINYQTNIFAKSVATGYYQTFTRDGFVDAGFYQNLDKFVKGWWVKGTLSYNTTLTQETNRSKQYQVFKMLIGIANDTTYQRFGTDPLPQQTNSSSVTDRTQQFYSEITSGITRNFGKNKIDALVLVNSDDYTSNYFLAEKYKNAAARMQYSFDDKYIFQASAAYMGNNRFISGKQAGFFPAAGFAWNVHNEKIMAKNAFVSLLKLRASYGLNGNANPGYYTFLSGYSGGTGYMFGTASGGVSGIQESSQSYVRTWEKSLKLNVGFDLGFLKNKGWLSVDYFNNKTSDLLQIRGNDSYLLGASYPLENLGKNNYSGVEFDLGWSDKKGKLSYSFTGNLSAMYSKVVFSDDPPMPYPLMQRTGKPVGQYYGYVADGFVTTAGQGPVIDGYVSHPGDIKYRDMNGDGVINQYDLTTIGSTRPFIYYGWGANFSYSNFYVDILFAGTANSQTMLTGNTVWEFQSNGKGQAYPHNLNRWTPATAASATYPRLTVGNNPNNNLSSTFWLTNIAFLRLKNAEIGYRFTNALMRKANLREMKVFVNGLNLLTFSSFKRADPETPFSNYPVQKVVNGGILITL